MHSKTFVALLNISQNDLLVISKQFPQLGYQTLQVAATTTKLALGTPAIPYL
jgi:hypothetical protein